MAEDKKELPEELLIEIALCLPLKSIARFKCVSKQWNFFLSSPEFVKSHPQRERIILIDESAGALHVIILATSSGGGSRPVKSQIWLLQQILGCCNGLVLLVQKNINRKSSLVVINPVTSRVTEVPNSLVPFSTLAAFGLGYSSVDDDYKIVVMFSNYGRSPKSTEVKIFSLKTQTWKKSADSPFRPIASLHYHYGVYTDGRLHWLAYDAQKLAIVVFDLSTEKFEELPAPTGVDRIMLHSYNLVVIGGCLALVTKSSLAYYSSDRRRVNHEPINVWIMEKSGYWRKLITISNYPPCKEDHIGDSYFPVCRLGEFEFILAKRRNYPKMVAYNCETGVWRDLDIDGLPKSFDATMIFTFTESLVCP